MNRKDQASIWISKETRDKLYSMRGSYTNYDKILTKLIENDQTLNKDDKIIRGICGKQSNRKKT